LFLVFYLTRFALAGTTRFPDVGLIKTVYLVVLGTHSLLALVVVPLVLRTLFLGTKGRWDEHRRLARVTLPLWLYVSVTGVLVYLMLYHLAPRLS
jgi:putative membrane protein